jgi:hypothetical protein
MVDGPIETKSLSPKSGSISKLNRKSNGTLAIEKAQKITFQLPERSQTQPNNKSD